MTLELVFKIVSYLAVVCGFISLWVTGAFGLIETLLFLGVVIAAWRLEGTRWRISERIGTALILLTLPLFYFGWRYQGIGGGAAIAEVLAKMIVVLSAIKLLQSKRERDWIFLYMMAFFELLLAAGLSISASYFGSLIAFLFVIVCTIVAFEIRKTSRSVDAKIRSNGNNASRLIGIPGYRLPGVALSLIVLIGLVAVPVFFSLPRVGGAGMGSNQQGLKTRSGFSASVTLGGIGSIQMSDEVVMRVRLENEQIDPSSMYFRGIALDTFDNLSWSRTRGNNVETNERTDQDFIQFEYPTGSDKLTVQTIFLEPLDVGVIFAMPRVIAVQGFPILLRDRYGAITINETHERVSYKVLSDRGEPSASELRDDDAGYAPNMANYLSLPEVYDRRIDQLASEIVVGADGKYEKAIAIERYLKTQFRYTLEQKAGGDQPLSSFLFDVREGHCEYFATAMAIMLRTQGVATRMVNGFHGGEYNETADITVVRQRNAHSWVEVYFPGANSWVKFDPTPYSDPIDSSGIFGKLDGYLVALETFWVEYFVAYDDQGQASLARSMKRSIRSYQITGASVLDDVRHMLTDWWRNVSGDRGVGNSVRTIGSTLLYLLGAVVASFGIIWAYRRIKPWLASKTLWNRFRQNDSPSMIVFYKRMTELLSYRGFVRHPADTPMEFALSTGIPEALSITRSYNKARYSGRRLSSTESLEIEELLETLKNKISGE